MAKESPEEDLFIWVVEVAFLPSTLMT